MNLSKKGVVKKEVKKGSINNKSKAKKNNEDNKKNKRFTI